MSRIQLSKAYSQYGADMGRGTQRANDPTTFDGRFRVRRVGLDSGGYDSGGAYWGTPDNLWQAESDDADSEYVVHYFRASSRDAVIDYVLAVYPHGRFFKGKVSK